MRKFAALLPVVLILAGCGAKPASEKKAAESAPVAVKTVAAASVEMPSVYEATGTVRARTTAQVSAKVMGYVREVKAQAGDTVKAGQVLILLDDRDLASGYRQAEAGLNEARQGMSEADNAIAAAKAQLDLTQVTLNRMKDLYDKKSISTQEFDDVSMKLKVAQANHEMALSRRNQLQARIRQAEEAVGGAGILKGYAEIKAPFAGVVTDKRVEPGNLAAPGQPLLVIEQAGALRLEAPVDESRLGSIRAGQSVSVTLDQPFQARVSEIVPAVDAASRSFLVKIDLPAMPRLRSGMFGRVFFPQGQRQVLMLPAGAVIEQGQVQSVMVAQDGYARGRLVTLGQRTGDRVEVLSGLAAGEAVIYPRPAGLADGARVEVRP
ncbi:MAG: efflux RND transporter periplasmic adaptor subunit [Acidobacteria bacterium]|nr:efflux RND transporter periplasmic adaptor subunit [Acidobacteriota bacterium]